MYRNLINTIFYVFLSQFVFSQQYDFEKLDKYFDSLKENNRFMGTVASKSDSSGSILQR